MDRDTHVLTTLEKLHADPQYTIASDVLGPKFDAVKQIDALVADMAGAIWDFCDALQHVSGSVT